MEAQSSYESIESSKNESKPKQQILAVQKDGSLCSSPSATSVKKHLGKVDLNTDEIFDQSNSEEYTTTSHDAVSFFYNQQKVVNMNL